jgi:hypothetical protein
MSREEYLDILWDSEKKQLKLSLFTYVNEDLLQHEFSLEYVNSLVSLLRRELD